MGIGSSLLQFVESLRQDLQQDPREPHPERATDRPAAAAEPAPAPASAPAGPVARRLAVLAEIERALGGSRQRLEAATARLDELRRKAGIGAGPGAGSPPAR